MTKQQTTRRSGRRTGVVVVGLLGVVAAGLWALEGLTGGERVRGGHDRPGVVRELLGLGGPDSATYALVASAHDELNGVVWGPAGTGAEERACRQMREAADVVESEPWDQQQATVAEVQERARAACDLEGRSAVERHDVLDHLEVLLADRWAG
ncbi:hypothetical protein [Egicoccus sp. AB-alg2]|uniref:hypothetical protein n=1 Tax=Egicoccus sp. AB-alg2 TaxID=3242693 RepID=UPI00359DD8F6